VIKNKLILMAATFSLVSSAAVFAVEQDKAATSDAASAKGAVTESVEKVSTKPAKAKKAKTVEQAQSSDPIKNLEKSINNLKMQIAELKKQQKEMHKEKDVDHHHVWGKQIFAPFVSTTPIIGEPAYDGSDLYINMPSINEDVAMLKFNQKLDQNRAKNNLPVLERPMLAFSGALEAQIYNLPKLNAGAVSKNDVDLSTGALEAVARVNPWITGVLRFEYNNTSSPIDASARTGGSQVRLKRGYITVGNFDKSPFYGTVGQMYTPFVALKNWLISDSLVQSIARIEARMLLLGFNTKIGAYGTIFGFKGDTYVGNNNNINQWGATLGYKFTDPKWNVDVGFGFIHNIADAMGLQNTGYKTPSYLAAFSQFEGFKGTFPTNNKMLNKQVPAVSAHVFFNYNPFSLSAEYVTTTGRFDPADMTFNGNNGAKLQALDVEGRYSFKVMEKPSFIAAGFGRTWEAAAANLPKQSYFVVVGTSLFKNTVQSIEYRYDINYSQNEVNNSTGKGKYVTWGADNRSSIVGSFKIAF
jgi:hypothetical protein